MSTSQPFLVLTAILDETARAAKITSSHGEALEKAIAATSGKAIAGLDVVDLPVPTASFQTLRRHLGFSEQTVAVYDLFPLSPTVRPDVRKVAGQLLAAEILWALDEQGLLSGISLNVKLDVPSGWEREPKALHERLVREGALELAPESIALYKDVKAAWDKLRTS